VRSETYQGAFKISSVHNFLRIQLEYISIHGSEIGWREAEAAVHLKGRCYQLQSKGVFILIGYGPVK